MRPPYPRPLLFPLLFLCAFFLSPPSHAAPPPTPRSATVLRVSDGDTILVRVGKEEIKVRLYGIDAPESKQPGGPEATAFLEDLLLTKKVIIKTLDVDKYGREVAEMSTIDGCILTSVQQEMLKKGLVWVYTKYCKADFCGRWKEIEQQARAEGVGLWKDGEAVEPWVWRKR